MKEIIIEKVDNGYIFYGCDGNKFICSTLPEALIHVNKYFEKSLDTNPVSKINDQCGSAKSN